MTSNYTSFLIRHWQLAQGESRVTIEHIQTGETITLASLDDALVWLGGRVAGGQSRASWGVSREAGVVEAGP